MIARLRRPTAAAISAAALALILAVPGTATAAQGLQVPVTGTVVGGGTFTGVLNLTQFVVQNGQLAAVGTLTGILTNAQGIATSVVQTITVPVSVGQATCQILHLDIGPISLTLLGLQVNISEIVIDITAQSGGLLGNLLCSVANLLNNPGALANLLNQILAAL